MSAITFQFLLIIITYFSLMGMGIIIFGMINRHEQRQKEGRIRARKVAKLLFQKPIS